MNNFEDRIHAYIEAHPKKCMQLLSFSICLLWMSVVCVIGLVFYFVLSKIVQLKWWLIFTLGMLMLFLFRSIDFYVLGLPVDFKTQLLSAFVLNKIFLKKLFASPDNSLFLMLHDYGWSYLMSYSMIFAGVLSTIDLIKENPHKKVIDAIKNGEHLIERQELTEKQVQAKLKNIATEKFSGSLLGISTYTGNPIVIPDHYVNQVLLVLGTTGAGKTITLRRFYDRAIQQKLPLIVIDGKPTNENVQWMQALAEKMGRTFYGFNAGNFVNYDPLAHGDCSELKDKIISLKDQWENDYYRSIAEDYLQTTFEVLLASNQPFDLKRVVECLDYDELQQLARTTQIKDLILRVSSLENYERQDITGLQAHLNILIHSAMGKYFVANDNAMNLSKAIQENAVVYFALPALRYPSFSKVLGKLVINDLKASIDRNSIDAKKVFMVFDEFSVFAGDQVLNLVNMGRGKGVHAIFGTQGLADLNRVDSHFKAQVLNCVNTMICHRLNDQESAEAISAWMGTKDTFTITAQYNSKSQDEGLGSIRADKKYVVHPEEIKQQLRTGEAFYVSKVDKYTWDKVRVLYT